MPRSVALAGRPSQAIGRLFSKDLNANPDCFRRKLPPVAEVETRTEYVKQFDETSLAVADLAMRVIDQDSLKIDEPLKRLLSIVRTMKPTMTIGEVHRKLFSKNDEQTWLQQLVS